MPMIATTIISSIRVQPFCIERFIEKLLEGMRGDTSSGLQPACQGQSLEKPWNSPVDLTQTVTGGRKSRCTSTQVDEFRHSAPRSSQVQHLPGTQRAHAVGGG